MSKLRYLLLLAGVTSAVLSWMVVSHTRQAWKVTLYCAAYYCRNVRSGLNFLGCDSYIARKGLRIRQGTFLHMVQGEAEASEFWLNVSRRQDSKLVFLSWRKRWTDSPAGVVYVFFSGDNSTFARGRNVMLAAGKRTEEEQGWLFEYFIFHDEDVSAMYVHPSTEKRFLSDLAFGDWRSYPPALSVFHRLLKEYRPVRASGSRAPLPRDAHARCQSTPSTDLAMDCFHRSAVDLLLPYDYRFDDYNYWLSAFLINAKVDAFFKPHAMQFHQICWDFHGKGAKHNQYPSNGGVSTSLLALTEYVRECFPKNSLMRTVYDAPAKWRQAGWGLDHRPYKECVSMPSDVNYGSCDKVNEVALHWISSENAGLTCRPDLVRAMIKKP